jgi:hypothetical protein
MKNLIIVIACIAVVLGAGFWFGLGTDGAKDALLTEDIVTPENKALLGSLATLKSITLDTSLFSDPAYLSLRDFSTQIIGEPVGRDNPFSSGLFIQATGTASGTRQSNQLDQGGSLPRMERSDALRRNRTE